MERAKVRARAIFTNIPTNSPTFPALPCKVYLGSILKIEASKPSKGPIIEDIIKTIKINVPNGVR